MKIRNTFIVLAAAGMVSASHAATLLDFTFDGVANDTGSFQVSNNNVGSGGTSNFTTGLITTGNSDNSASGFNNSMLVSLAGYTSFTATFVIDSITLNPTSTTVADLLANGMFFGVVAGTNATSTTAGYGATGSYIGYVPGSVNRGDHVVSSRVSSGSIVNDGIASTQPSDASLKDGITISLTLNSADAWTISSTGLDVNLSDSGTITGLWTAMSGGVGLYSNLQGDAGGQLDLARMTLTAVPEPSSALLVGLGALGFLAHRRRRP